MDKDLAKIDEEPLKVTEEIFIHDVPNEEVLIMKNLRLEGYKLFDRFKGMDIPHTILVLEEMARFHATSLVYQNRLQRSLQQEYERDFAVRKNEKMN